MPPRKQNNTADFGDILSSFDRRETEEAPAPLRRARRPEPELEAEPSTRRVRKTGCGACCEYIPAWPTGIGGLIGGFGPRPQAPMPRKPPKRKPLPRSSPAMRAPKPETEKLEAARIEPAKTEDQAIAEELGLSPDLAIVDLQRLRRDFAKKIIRSF